MNCNTEVMMRPVVAHPQMKGPWCPTTRVVMDTHFFCDDKWDRKLNMFCTGRGLSLKRGRKSNINCKFIDSLAKLRSEASDIAVAKAYEDDATEGDQDKKRKKARKAKASDADIAPPIVDIEVPDVHRANVMVDGRRMRVLFGVKNHPVWLELTAENLDYVRHAVLADVENNEVGRRWGATKPDGDGGEEVACDDGSDSNEADSVADGTERRDPADGLSPA